MKHSLVAIVTVMMVALVAASAAAQVRLDLGTASGGIMIYYNQIDNNGANGVPDGVVSGYDENPYNIAYTRAQFSDMDTSGMAFQFDTADLGGFSWNDVFSGQPEGSSQYGFDFICQADTYDSAGGVTLPEMDFVDYDWAGPNLNNVHTPVIPPETCAWVLNVYQGGSSSGPGTGSEVRNSTIRGTEIAMTFSNVQFDGVSVYTVDFEAGLLSDGLIHWYGDTGSNGDGTTDLSSWGLSDTFYMSGTLSYDMAGDFGADQMDWYAGDIVIQTELVPEPATLCLLGLGALAIIRRRK